MATTATAGTGEEKPLRKFKIEPLPDVLDEWLDDEDLGYYKIPAEGTPTIGSFVFCVWVYVYVLRARTRQRENSSRS